MDALALKGYLGEIFSHMDVFSALWGPAQLSSVLTEDLRACGAEVHDVWVHPGFSNIEVEMADGQFVYAV